MTLIVIPQCIRRLAYIVFGIVLAYFYIFVNICNLVVIFGSLPRLHKCRADNIWSIVGHDVDVIRTPVNIYRCRKINRLG